ncbi:MAG: RNA-processing protein [Candidatus Aenigmarchaeota archaeon]|nr:RNA-processing protein [Candidatus Aenigmarchaeota archaeon]
MQMIRKIKIPEERIPVLIGRNGSTKREIQKSTNTAISVEDEISIDGESVDVMAAENIVKAIGRGFPPDVAMILCKEENALEIINLPKERKELNRIKSRLIGTKGKSRRNIELLTGTHISVFGKTVSIIGEYEGVRAAYNAIEKLIKGQTHKSVYKFLEESK